MKPLNLIKTRINATRINDLVINTLEIDLRHVNFGLDENKEYNTVARSCYDADDIGKLFEQLNGLELEPYVDNEYQYFSTELTSDLDELVYRIVFCVNENSTETGGVITLFRIKEEIP